MKKVVVRLLTVFLCFNLCSGEGVGLEIGSPARAGELVVGDVSEQGRPASETGGEQAETDKSRDEAGYDVTVELKAPIDKVPVLKPRKIKGKNAQQFCADKRFSSSRMSRQIYESCLKKQQSGYREIESLNKEYEGKSFYSDMIYPYCSNKWVKESGMTNAYRMAHCLKMEIMGVKEVLRYQKKYNKEKVVEVVEKALIRYGSWKRAAIEVQLTFK